MEASLLVVAFILEQDWSFMKLLFPKTLKNL